MEWIVFVVLGAGIWLSIWALRGLIRLIFGTSPTAQTGSATAGMAGVGLGATSASGSGGLAASDEIDGMNEGDYHSGPAGYSPMTAYPDTQYGSGLDEDAARNEHEQ